MNAVIYLRVSTKEQARKDDQAEGYSIPAQREACIRYVADQGWNLVGEFTEPGASGRSTARPGLRAMLERISQGDVGVVVVHKVDRFARDTDDHALLRIALRKHGARLASAVENFDESPSGRMIEGIHAVLAQFYSDNLATEIRKGLGQKAKAGGWPTRAPVGYLNVRERIAGRDVARIVLDPAQALLVREAFRLYATGDYSLAELREHMAARGLRSPYARSRDGAPSVGYLAKMLRNPFYVGVVDWRGAQYPGTHKPLLPRSLYDEVARVLAAHDTAGVRQRTHDHYLKGLLRCSECGKGLSLTLAKGSYLYFYCLGQKRPRSGCRQRYVLAQDAERAVAEHYGRVQLSPEWVDRLTAELEEQIVARQESASGERVRITRELAALAEERHKLLRAYYAEAIPLDMLKAEQDRISRAEDTLKVEQATSEARPCRPAGRARPGDPPCGTVRGRLPAGVGAGSSAVQRGVPARGLRT